MWRQKPVIEGEMTVFPAVHRVQMRYIEDRYIIKSHMSTGALSVKAETLRLLSKTIDPTNAGTEQQTCFSKTLEIGQGAR